MNRSGRSTDRKAEKRKAESLKTVEYKTQKLVGYWSLALIIGWWIRKLSLVKYSIFVLQDKLDKVAAVLENRCTGAII